ncbi:hypothetical protein NC653_021277 [Populus alba x Populus x berolinensis]|uniref:Uncharacterized protein n=1 Tax=Populus alba x Populus x berolinensis TaxID=444605 RepID=A0AAD6QDG2_9ROSI|nr:hypothetical protein NC653_021277 [Populus alba x Populus x berolinensis]
MSGISLDSAAHNTTTLQAFNFFAVILCIETAGMVQENATFKEIILSSGSGYWKEMATNSQHLLQWIHTHIIDSIMFSL